MLLLSLAFAAPLLTPDRPSLPFRSLAGEDGTPTLYENPALLTYDRDAMFGLYYDMIYDQQETTGTPTLSSMTLATTSGGLGAGVGYRQVGAGESWWTITGGIGLRLDGPLTMGTALHWQLPDGGDNNFVSWDLGLGWRPMPFIGFGASAKNLGNPAPELGVFTRYGAGVALRPANDVLIVGLDWQAQAPPESSLSHHAVASLKVRPVRGLWLEIYGDQDLEDFTNTEVGAAIQVNVGGLGFGPTVRTNVQDPSAIGMGGYVASTSKEDQLFLPGKTVAEFHFKSGYSYLPFPGQQEESYLTMLRRLKEASVDPQVKGILLTLDGVGFSYAQIEEMQAVIAEARANRKPVVAFLGQDGSTRAYFLATACDRVYLHPAGSLDLIGLSAEIQYYKGAMEMVGVEAQYAKRAEYKSAPEASTREGSSDPAREEMNVLLDDLYGQLVDSIARGRGQPAEKVRELIDGGPYTGKEAEEKGLIDGLLYPDELDDALVGIFPDGFDRDEEYRMDPDSSGWLPSRAIAVVVVDGAIISGPSSPGGLLGGSGTGAESVIQQLDQARRSPAVRAVVLRVDSPGGSAFASDEIWRAIEKVKEAGKPVIVSMGGYAASGGYYVSAGADAILALPSTVTGSIGVYGGKYNAQGLFETLHINTETYLRGRNAAMYSMTRPFDDVEYAVLDRMIEDTYRQFKEKVELGRGLTPEQVEEVARGRVWSGEAAKERGLVDEIGGFFDAVELAKVQAGMGEGVPYALVVYNPWYGSGSGIPAFLVESDLLAKVFPHMELPPALKQMVAEAYMSDERVYAMLPYALEIK